MPATEQTWRDQKRLHTIFAVTGVVMLIATLWMLADDHAREWKPIQRTADRIETKTTEWRKLQFATNAAVAEHGELENALIAARRKAAPPELIEAFKRQAVEGGASEDDLQDIDEAARELAEVAGQEGAEEYREELLEELADVIQEARFREETLLGQRKFKSADRDAAVAELGLLVRDGKVEEQPAKQAEVDQLKAELDELTRQYQVAADHRNALREIQRQITEEVDAAADASDKYLTQLRMLETANAERRSTYFTWAGPVPIPGKKWLELPILDAFNSPRKVENLWSDGLEIDYNFSKVRRFDRCTTCHQLIEKSQPGTADVAAYPQERLVDFVLVPPSADEEAAAEPAVESVEGEVAAEAVAEEDGGRQRTAQDQLEEVLGIRLAAEGLLDRSDVTVQFVLPNSAAARAESLVTEEERQPVMGDEIRDAMLRPGVDRYQQTFELPGLRVGDVIVEINQDGNRIYDAERTSRRLLGAAASGEQLVVTVRRGMPSPYASHPRLDLFVGSLSPHQMSKFACSICHEGQGSATEFKWASHTPNTLEQREAWRREYGWFDNHHWIYPMYAARFAESACLKCHHDVTELRASARYPDPPAPKVMHGYDLVRKYGCYGCHEINGYDGPERIGPDLRLEPNTFAAAQQLKTDPGFESLSGEQLEWVEQLIEYPGDDVARRRLYQVLEEDKESTQPDFSAQTHAKLTPLFKDSENPGELRKAGPSLRFIAHKADLPFLSDWIREPQHFRPSTRMPQFFGQRDHLVNSSSEQVAEAFEAVEVLGLATFLLNKSQEFDYLEPAEGTAAGSVERGKVLFEERGCLACHNHKDFPDTAEYRTAGEIVQGPNLSGVSDKFQGEQGRRWLYTWIREPTRYHVRTVMPDLQLEPIEDAEGNLTDPVSDIVAYLLEASSVGWQPAPQTQTAIDQVNEDDLNALVVTHLRDVFSEASAEQYAQTGIPAEFREELKGPEVELAASSDPAYLDRGLTREQKLNYIGGKAVAKYGCYGCHDIPGYEDAKPIGTGLADWGRKDPSKLAFEHITNYLHGGHGHGEGHASDHPDEQPAMAASPGESNSDHAAASEHGAGMAHKVASGPIDPYFLQQIESHNRIGFVYQKLREPRSYDYHKTENKRYNEWLRMPQFPFDAAEREAVVTFVLGLVADPPSEKYVYQPDETQRAIIKGKQVLEKYNCGGCHLLEPQQWAISYPPEFFGVQPESKQYPFLATHFAPEELDQSRQTDSSGLRHSLVRGLPTVDDFGQPLMYDEEGDPVEADYDYDPTTVEYPFDLWQPASVDGSPFEVGGAPLIIPARNIREKRPTNGGFLAKYLVPRVVEREKQSNPNAKGTEAWGWVPPPLVGEGHKVQTDWLHSFLLNPYPIRPAVVLRMPRFNMSPEEASQLVNYFAAIDGAEYPYAFSKHRQEDHLKEAAAAYRAQSEVEAPNDSQLSARFRDAMQIVVDSNYCVKCHLVGDFEPPGGDIAKAPNLADVYERLRPEYLRKWIANPKSILPYTSMPVNIPYDPDAPQLGGVSQELYHGTSIEQVNALVDLLMNFDEYSRQRSQIAPLVKEVVPAGGQTETAAGGGGGE